MGGLLSRLTEGVLRFFFVQPTPVAIEASNEPAQTKSVVRRKYESEEVIITSTSSGGPGGSSDDVIDDEGASIVKEAENALDSPEGGGAPPSDDQTVPEAIGYDALPEHGQEEPLPVEAPEVEQHETAPADIPESDTASDDVKPDVTTPTPMQSAVFEQASGGRLNVDEERKASLEIVNTEATTSLGHENLVLRPSDSESSQDFKDSICGEAIPQETMAKDSEPDLRFVDSVSTLTSNEVKINAEKPLNCGEYAKKTPKGEDVDFAEASNCQKFAQSDNSETHLDFEDSISGEIKAQSETESKICSSKKTVPDSKNEQPSLGQNDSDTSLQFKYSVSEMAAQSLAEYDTIKPSVTLADSCNTQHDTHELTSLTTEQKATKPSDSDSNLDFKDSKNVQQSSDENLASHQNAEENSSVSKKDPDLQETPVQESEKKITAEQQHIQNIDSELNLHFQDSLSDVIVKQEVPEGKSKSFQQPPDAKEANTLRNLEVKALNDINTKGGLDSAQNLHFKGTVKEMEMPDYSTQNTLEPAAVDPQESDNAKKSPPDPSSKDPAAEEDQLTACDKASEYQLARDPFGSHPRIDRSNIDLNPQPAQSTSSLYVDAPTSLLTDDVTNDVNAEEKKAIRNDKSCPRNLNLGDVVGCEGSEVMEETSHALTSLPADDVITDVSAVEQQGREAIDVGSCSRDANHGEVVDCDERGGLSDLDAGRIRVLDANEINGLTDVTDAVGEKAIGRGTGKNEVEPIKVLYSAADDSDLEMVNRYGLSRDGGEFVIESSTSREHFDAGVVDDFDENVSDANEIALKHDFYRRDDFVVEPSYASYDQDIHSAIHHHENAASYDYGDLPQTVVRDDMHNQDNYGRDMESNHEIHEMTSVVKELDHEVMSEMQNVLKYKHHNVDHELVGDAELSRELPRVIVREIHREVQELVHVNWMENHYEGMDTNGCQDIDVKMNQHHDITVKHNELCDPKSSVRVSVIENHEEIANGNGYHDEEASQNGYHGNGESRTLIRVNLVETDESILHGNGYHEVGGSQNGYHGQIASQNGNHDNQGSQNGYHDNQGSQNGYHDNQGSQNGYHDEIGSQIVYHKQQQNSHHEIHKMAAEGDLGVVVSWSHQCQSSVARGSEKGPEMSDGDPDKRVEGESSSIPMDPQCDCDRGKFTDENPHLVRRVTWFGPAENVHVTGSWLNWENKIQLTNIGHDVWQTDVCFEGVDDVSVELKFVVDTMWLTSPNMLTSESSIGSTNNIIYLRGSE